MIRRLKHLISNNKLEAVVFLLIIIVSAGMRFYRLPDYMTFLGDEGRDAIIVKKIITQGNFPLLGPPTSVGNMYNGPLYYYMMAVPMTIFWLNPAAAAGMVAVLGTLAVGLIYYLTRTWFGTLAAITSSTLYSISPVNIIYSRSSWNPNPAPFFSLLIMLGLFKAQQTKNYLWFVLVGVALAFIIQMHLLSLILIPVILILWGLEFYQRKWKKLKGNHFWLGSTLGVLSFLLLMSPMVIFDLRHNFINFKAFYTFFFGDRAATVNLNIFNSLGRVIPIYHTNLVDKYISGSDTYLNFIVSVVIILPVIYSFYLIIKKRLNWPLLLLSLWLMGGILGLSLYKLSIFDHYLSFFNPAPFVLFGSLIFLINQFRSLKPQKLYLGLVGILFIVLLVVNIQRSPLLIPPNNQLERTQQIASFIIQKSSNKPFNFALLSAHNYDAAYQYYLGLYGHMPEAVPFKITDQLLVVCEDPVCEPVNNPKYEIAAFGWVKIANQTDFAGVKVFKLIHNI